ncbi:MAG TPA: TIGR01777 family oxidoreductase, partial [Bacteroidia bacterium]|nr:TIGR01777 family oxidoreductase [Bacteroidia bacterium]
PFPSANYILLSRKKGELVNGARVVYWDGVNPDGWCQELESADVLINLCGRTVDCRYTEKNKREILNSRVQPTLALGQAISGCKTPPSVWINAGSATIYRYAEDRSMDENTGEYGTGFSVGICQQWEEAFNSIRCPETRKIVLRISMVLGRDHGVLPVLGRLAKKGLGGTMGKGQQKMSWIHEEDVAGIVAACIRENDWSGVFNCTAPVPTTNIKFMNLVRKAVKAPFHFRTPAWILEIGAFFLRTETELVLKSRWVVPGRLIKKGFQFRFNTAVEAIADLT